MDNQEGEYNSTAHIEEELQPEDNDYNDDDAQSEGGSSIGGAHTKTAKKLELLEELEEENAEVMFQIPTKLDRPLKSVSLPAWAGGSGNETCEVKAKDRFSLPIDADLVGVGDAAAKKAGLGGIDEEVGTIIPLKETPAALGVEDIVVYNHHAQPYIDINRLVYKPKKKQQIKHKESVMSYLPDFTFIGCNALSLVLSSFFLATGIIVVSWSASIKSLYPQEPNTINKDTPTIIRLLSLNKNPVSAVGLVFICVAIANAANVLLGIYAAVFSIQTILILHVIIDIGILIAEVSLGVISKHSNCSIPDMKKFEKTLHTYIQLYGTDVPEDQELRTTHAFSIIQLDLIQISLSCCGLNSWADYLNYDITKSDKIKKTSLDGTDLVIPTSCCRPWWIRNVYCSASAHHWVHPAVEPIVAERFRERINQDGCVPKVFSLCESTVDLMGKKTLMVAGLHGVLCIAEVVATSVIVKHIMALLEKKKNMLKKEETQTFGEVDSEESDTQSLSCESKNEIGHVFKLIPPTEDQIQQIKTRSDFNRFEVRAKRTPLGKLLYTARKSVHLAEKFDVPDEPGVHEPELPTPLDLNPGKLPGITDDDEIFEDEMPMEEVIEFHHKEKKQMFLPPVDDKPVLRKKEKKRKKAKGAPSAGTWKKNK